MRRIETTMADGNAPGKAVLFALVADPQLGMQGGEEDWSQDLTTLNQGIEAINRLEPKPAFCGFVGDLVHHHPDIYTSVKNCSDIFARQVADVKASIACLHSDIPRVIAAGNHDVGNTPTAASLKSYREEFGDDWYFVDVTENLRVIVLNSSLLFDDSGAREEAEAQRRWLDTDDVLGGTASKVVLLHHPLYLHDEEEPDNITSRSHLDGQDFSNRYFHLPSRNRAILLKLFRRGSVVAVFAGHFHQCWETTQGDPPIAMVTSGALGKQLGRVDEDGTKLPPAHGAGIRLVKFFPPDESNPPLITSRFFDLGSLPTHKIPLNRDAPDEW